MNDELQSTNTQLETTNQELQKRTDQVGASNAFLTSILRSLRRAVIVADPALRVQVWNEAATDLWGLRPEEAVGQPLLDLDIGLPFGELETPIRECLTTGTTQTVADRALECVTRRGKTIMCHVSFAPLLDASGEPEGVVVVVDQAALEGGG